jgi:hypothetical protein
MTCEEEEEEDDDAMEVLFLPFMMGVLNFDDDLLSLEEGKATATAEIDAVEDAVRVEVKDTVLRRVGGDMDSTILSRMLKVFSTFDFLAPPVASINLDFFNFVCYISFHIFDKC